jgi:hypothetical protein
MSRRGPARAFHSRDREASGRRYERLYVSMLEAELQTSVVEHRAIVRAIRGGNAPGARAAVETNWRNAAERLAAWWPRRRTRQLVRDGEPRDDARPERRTARTAHGPNCAPPERRTAQTATAHSPDGRRRTGRAVVVWVLRCPGRAQSGQCAVGALRSRGTAQSGHASFGPCVVPRAVCYSLYANNPTCPPVCQNRHGRVARDAPIANVGDERGERLRRVRVVDEQRLGARREKLCLRGRRCRHAIATTNERVVDLDRHIARDIRTAALPTALPFRR